MSYRMPMLIREPQLRWPIVLLAAIITGVIALMVAGLHYLVMNPSVLKPYPPPRLEGLRAGDRDFEHFREQIAIGDVIGTEKLHPFNNLSVALTATVTNTTGRTITGLELRGAIVDSKGSLLRERTVVVIPTRQTALEPDEAMNVRILLERLKPGSERDRISLEVTAVRFDLS